MELDWKDIWERVLKNNKLFPHRKISNNKIELSCPTRFSSIGAFNIEVTAKFNDDYIELELLTFNDNITLDDLENIEVDDTRKQFNALSTSLNEFESKNKIQDRFEIKSDGFESDDEAESALLDYLNSKATESGRSFDDKLDELNDAIERKSEKLMKHNRILNVIRENRKNIFNKIGSILHNNYGWKPSKKEAASDTATSFYDKNHNLVAIVSLDDDTIVIDLSKDITAHISMLQSDQDIENEIINDIEDANTALAEQELQQLKDAVASNPESDISDVYNTPMDYTEDDYLDDLSNRLSKLESRFINRQLNRLY